MLTRRAKAYSMHMLICNCVSRKTGQHQKNSNFYGGTALWCPRVLISLNLENRELGHRNLRSVLKISYAASPCLSQLILVQIALEMCPAARNHQKIHKNPYFSVQGHPRSLNSVAIKSQFDYLLVINSNLGPISHRYWEWDTATYWLKITNFSHPLSFSALVRGDPLQIHEKALRFLKLESSRQPTVKILWS